MYITSDMDKSKNFSHDHTEHLKITKHTDGSSSVCSAKCTNGAYISAIVNIVKMY